MRYQQKTPNLDYLEEILMGFTFCSIFFFYKFRKSGLYFISNYLFYLVKDVKLIRRSNCDC